MKRGRGLQGIRVVESGEVPDHAALLRHIIDAPGEDILLRVSCAARLLSHSKTTDTGCRIWTGLLSSSGYGRINTQRRVEAAHRLAYHLWRGPVPEKVDVCHRCDNPACFEPTHLFLGTRKENMRDMVAKGRSGFGAKNSQSKLTDDKVIDARSRFARGETLAVLSKELGVSPSTLSTAISGKKWAHLRVIGSVDPLANRRRGTRLTKSDVAKVKALIAEGATDKEIANQFGVGRTNINHIRLGKIWADVPANPMAAAFAVNAAHGRTCL